jgi:F-type H+-transporting ATPase subunit delta
MTTETTTTIARPYAKAAFEYALAKHELPVWETMLQAAASLTDDKSIVRMLASPKVSQKELADLFCEILKPMLNAERKNFISLLAENKRLSALPAIKMAFEDLRAEYEKTLTVQVTSAIALDEPYQLKITQALTKRLQRKVSLECNVDPELLGGVIVHAGDLVLDGSVRGKLNRLIEFI